MKILELLEIGGKESVDVSFYVWTIPEEYRKLGIHASGIEFIGSTEDNLEKVNSIEYTVDTYKLMESEEINRTIYSESPVKVDEGYRELVVILKESPKYNKYFSPELL